MRYELSAKPEVVTYLASGKPHGDLIARVDSWLTERGYVRGEELTSVRSDGVIAVDTDRDPAPEWDDFDPSVEVGQHAANRQRKVVIRNGLTQLDAGTMTAVNVQKVVAWLVRRELGIQDGSG